MRFLRTVLAVLLLMTWVSGAIAQTIVSQNWDGVTAPSIPTGWTTVASSGQNFLTYSGGGYSGANSLGFNANATTVLPAIYCTASDAGATENYTFSAVFAGVTTTSSQLIMFFRATTTPGVWGTDTCYFVDVGWSAGIGLYQHIAGTQTQIGTTVGGSGAFVVGTWYTISANYNNGVIYIYAQRPSFLANGTTANPGGDNKYLNSSGAWVTGQTASITQTVGTSTITGAGKAGFYVAAMENLGAARFDDFSMVANTSATSFTLTGPSGGYTGVTSTNFTLGPTSGSALAASETVTLSDGGAGGTFSPSSTVTFASGATATQNFTYTPPAGVATRTITANPSPALGTAPTANYAVTTPPAATAYTVTGAVFGASGANTTYTITSNGFLASSTPITITATNGATITTSPASLPTGTNTSVTFTVSLSSGLTVMTFTNSGTLTNPGTATYSIVRTTPATYYLDTGGDGTTGLVGHAFSTLAQATTGPAGGYIAGDTLKITSGQSFTGTLTWTVSGTLAAPCTITTTGTGAAIINTVTVGNDGLRLQDCGYISVSNLTLTGPGISTSGGVGYHLLSTAATNGTASFYKNIFVDKLTISGYKYGVIYRCTGGNAITYFSASPPFPAPPLTKYLDTNSHPVGASALNTATGMAVGYDNVRLTNLVITSALDQGITTCLNDPDQSAGPNGLFFNHLFFDHMNISGVTGQTVGISTGEPAKFMFCANSTCQNSVFHDSGLSGGGGGGGPTGTFPFVCSNFVIQYCEAYGIQSSNGIDGGGFDIDGACDHCVIQYCYAHDCEGAGFEVGEFTNGVLFPTYACSTRYCVSYNCAQNQQGDLQIFNGSPLCAFYNNTVYAGTSTYAGLRHRGGTRPCFVDSTMGGVVENNLFYLTSASIIGNGGSNCYLEGNAYWSDGGALTIPNNTADSKPVGVNVNPLVSGTVTNQAPTGLGLTTFDLQSGSPLIDTGIDALNGTNVTLTNVGPFLDYHGVPVNHAGIGATQYPFGGYPVSTTTTVVSGTKRRVQ